MLSTPMRRMSCIFRSNRGPLGRWARGALGVGAVASVLLSIGCQSVWRQGTAPKSVIEARRLSQQGLACMERGDWREAEAEFAAAVKACPTDVEARRHYADTLLQRGDVVAAMVQLDEALRLSNHDPRIAVRAGELYLREGRTERAMALAESSLIAAPHLSEAWALRGRARLGQGPSHAALTDLQRALAHRPDDPQLLLEIAEQYTALGAPDRALLALQTCAETYPAGEAPVQLAALQGRALAAQGRHALAAEQFEIVSRQMPNHADVWCDLAWARRLSGDASRADEALQQALRLHPQHPSALRLTEEIARSANPAAVTAQR